MICRVDTQKILNEWPLVSLTTRASRGKRELGYLLRIYFEREIALQRSVDGHSFRFGISKVKITVDFKGYASGRG